jgi:hypothetical protein
MYVKFGQEPEIVHFGPVGNTENRVAATALVSPRDQIIAHAGDVLGRTV